jgi:CubicO group peptidase (beta-lactamase class C family)
LRLDRRKFLKSAAASAALAAAPAANAAWLPVVFNNHSWGFGVSVVTDRHGVAAVPGQFGWDGGSGTSWRSDPREGMVITLITHRAWTSPGPPNVCLDFWTSAYHAVDD